jgi:hypothetical protein
VIYSHRGFPEHASPEFLRPQKREKAARGFPGAAWRSETGSVGSSRLAAPSFELQVEGARPGGNEVARGIGENHGRVATARFGPLLQA